MLSQVECIGLEEILNDIDDDDLFSVLETVSKKMFSTSFRHEAVEKILFLTEKPSDLLKRQKITKKLLFNYLVKKEISVVAEWGKARLINKCLELWKSTESCNEDDFVEVEDQRNPCEGIDAALMGVEFSKWFFKILNTLDGFGSEHFWPKCNLSAQLCTPSDKKEVSVSGASDVATFLANLILIDKYYFHANESKDKILLELEEHGLVKIIIHGVLHQHSTCVGLFDSAFGLVKHPNSPNTYKIQVIKVKLLVNITSQGALPVNNQLSIYQTS